MPVARRFVFALLLIYGLVDAQAAWARQPLPEPNILRLTDQQRAQVQARGLREAALDPAFVQQHHRNYTFQIPFERVRPAVTDEGRGDRSWACAALTVFSSKAMVRRNQAPEPLSVAFLTYQLLHRRASGILSDAMAVDGRINLGFVSRNLEVGGGTFGDASRLIKAAGIVPARAMPLTVDGRTNATDGHLGILHDRIGRVLVRAVLELEAINERMPGADDATKAARTAEKKRVSVQALRAVDGVLDTVLGRPPARFAVGGQLHTPQSYAREVLGLADDDFEYVSLSCDTTRRAGRPYRLGKQPIYNVTMETLEELMKATLHTGQAVYLMANLDGGSPARVADGEGTPRAARGILSPGAFRYDRIVPVPPFAAEDERRAGVLPARRAVAITGYDLEPGGPRVRKWKAVAGLGPAVGDEGVFHLYRDFLARYGGRVAVPRAVVPDRLLAEWNAAAAPNPGPARPAEAWSAEERSQLVLRLLDGTVTVRTAAEVTGLEVGVIDGWLAAGRAAVRAALERLPGVPPAQGVRR